MKKVNKSITLIDGHYEMALPFRSDIVQLPDNKHQAIGRLHHLVQEASTKPPVYFMGKLISSEYAELVPERSNA